MRPHRRFIFGVLAALMAPLLAGAPVSAQLQPTLKQGKLPPTPQAYASAPATTGLRATLQQGRLPTTAPPRVSTPGLAQLQPALQQGFLPPKPQAQPSQDIRARARLSGVSGWLVVDLQTGLVIDSHKAGQAFAPASVAKLPTAAFALDALGSDYRFQTRVLAAGPINGGQLDGDLVLAGGGNPELDTDALAPLVAQVRARGVHRVRGALIADGSALPQLRAIEPSQGEVSSYNPSISGLNLNFNRVHLKWDARRGPSSLSVEAAADGLSPPVQGVRVALSDRAGAPVFAFDGASEHEQWRMARRAFRGRAARWLPVKGPEAYAAEVFSILAAEQGLRIEGSRLGPAPQDAQVLATHQSRPLGPIVRDMLRYSVNLTAEVTGSAATRAVGMDAQTLVESADVMNAWAAAVAGFPQGDPGFRFVNHSGLTTESRVSPRRMVDLLMALSRRAAPSDGRHARLPGAIAGYLRVHNVSAVDVPLNYDRLDVVAKTGTMSYVRGLAGYVATPGGRQLAFAIFSNNLAARSKGATPVHRGWMRRAKEFERALIRNWVLQVDAS